MTPNSHHNFSILSLIFGPNLILIKACLLGELRSQSTCDTRLLLIPIPSDVYFFYCYLYTPLDLFFPSLVFGYVYLFMDFVHVLYYGYFLIIFFIFIHSTIVMYAFLFLWCQKGERNLKYTCVCIHLILG